MRMSPILTSTTSQGAILCTHKLGHTHCSSFKAIVLFKIVEPIKVSSCIMDLCIAKRVSLSCFYQPRFKLQGGVWRLGSLLWAKLPGKSHLPIWRWLDLIQLIISGYFDNKYMIKLSQMTVWVMTRQMPKKRATNRWYASLYRKNIPKKEPNKESTNPRRNIPKKERTKDLAN